MMAATMFVQDSPRCHRQRFLNIHYIFCLQEVRLVASKTGKIEGKPFTSAVLPLLHFCLSKREA